MLNRREWLAAASASGLAACQTVPAPRGSVIATPGLSAAGIAFREDAALQALDRYLETWNTRDATRWATSLAFPHVRPGPGAFEVFQNERDYIAAQNFERTLATGWRYTRWDKREVLQVGPEKVHIAGWWRRYTGSGETIQTSQICYLIVPTDGHADGPWRVQSRFATGVTLGLAPEVEAENLARARAALDAYKEAFNSQDPERLAAAVHTPFVRHGDNRLEYWLTKDAFLAGPEPGRARTWAGTRLRNIRNVDTAVAGSSFTLTCDRLGPDGAVQSTHEALYLVTTAENDPSWKVRAISSFGT